MGNTCCTEIREKYWKDETINAKAPAVVKVEIKQSNSKETSVVKQTSIIS